MKIRNLVLLSIFCTTNIFAAMQGKLVRNQYTSPDGVIRMDVPSLSSNIPMKVKQRIDDFSGERVTIVRFVNDYGNNIQVEAFDIGKDAVSNIQKSDERFQDLTEDMFTDVLKDDWKVMPEIISKETFVDERLGKTFFGVVKLPSKGSSPDVKMGYLWTLSKDHLVIIKIQYSPVGDITNDIIRKHAKGAPTNDYIQELKDQLITVRRSMQFRVKENNA